MSDKMLSNSGIIFSKLIPVTKGVVSSARKKLYILYLYLQQKDHKYR